VAIFILRRILKFSMLVLLSFGAGCTSSPVSSSSATAYQGLGAESISKEQLSKYTGATLPPAISEQVQSYFDLRPPQNALVTEDGKRIYFNWRVTGLNQVWHANGIKSFPTQLTGGENPSLLKGMTSDGHFLIISRDHGGEENPGLFLQNAFGGPLQTILQMPKVQTHFAGVSADNRWIYFTANDIDPKSFAVYRYSIRGRTRELLYSAPGTWEIMDIAKDGSLLLAKETSNVKNEIFLLGTDKILKPLFGAHEDSYFIANFAAQEDEYLVATTHGENFKALYAVKGDRWKKISSPANFDVANFYINEGRNTLFYSSNEKGHSKLHWLDMNSFAEKKTNFPSGLLQEKLNFITPQGQFATLSFEFKKGPPKNYLFNLKTQQLQEWQNSSVPEIDAEAFAVPKDESYTARDGMEIPMIVRRPQACEKPDSHCPVIVSFHGGPEGQATPGFNITAQLFVDQGFIFVEPNVRGSDGYGLDWLNSDNGAKRLKVITDIEDASLWIRKNWGAQKVGVMGGSYGGYATLYAMTKFAGAYDAGVEIVGMSNLLTFLKNTASYRRALRQQEYGDPEKDEEALRELSPITHLNKIKAPLLMIQGVNDPRVPVGEALQINSELDRKSIPHELVLFADEGHGAQKRNNQVIQIGKALQFFREHLQNSSEK
jgi:dipeptidyl aminopeptidase/acylaminoacyl peptidase